MEEITLNETSRHRTTNLGIYVKHSFQFFAKSYATIVKPKQTDHTIKEDNICD